MDAAFVSQQTPSGGTDFDRILSSIAGGISDYLGRPTPVQPIELPPAPIAAPMETSDWLFIGLVAAGVYLLMR